MYELVFYHRVTKTYIATSTPMPEAAAREKQRLWNLAGKDSEAYVRKYNGILEKGTD